MQYDSNKYKAFSLPHPLLIHWVLNPGLAFCEVVLGQRLPKLTLIDKTSDAPLLERQFVPCPHCETLNDARLWSAMAGFGNWFGLLCPRCFKTIPCLWNLTSLVFLALSFPIWFFIRKFGYARWFRWKKSQLARAQGQSFTEAKKISGLKMGLAYGAMMFCFMEVPKIWKSQLVGVDILVHIGIWLGAGLLFGFSMKAFLTVRNKKKSEQDCDGNAN